MHIQSDYTNGTEITPLIFSFGCLNAVGHLKLKHTFLSNHIMLFEIIIFSFQDQKYFQPIVFPIKPSLKYFCRKLSVKYWNKTKIARSNNIYEPNLTPQQIPDLLPSYTFDG
mgnify:CR=1 FL=1